MLLYLEAGQARMHVVDVMDRPPLRMSTSNNEEPMVVQLEVARVAFLWTKKYPISAGKSVSQ